MIKMKKSKSIDLKSMWERAAKKRRVDSPCIESQAQAQPEVATSNEPETEIAAIVPKDQISIEPEVASKEPQLTTGVSETEPSHLSPIRDGERETDYESSGGAVYDTDSLFHDPGKRISINRYPVNERNSVIKGYIALGPCQPRSHDFPIRDIGGKPRRFVAGWFDEFSWLEYSVELDSAFCFVCFLFNHKTNCSGGDAFVSGGFRNWHLKKRFERHCGAVNSHHNMALEKYNSFVRPKATIVEKFAGPSPLSPIRDGKTDYESSGEAVYDIDSLFHDPGKRIPIKRYPVNERNSVIKGYIALGPCQPRSHDFPIRDIGGKPRRFVARWFDEFSWLEYSVELDAAFCFVCFLFKHKTNCSGGDAFVSGGFRNWHLKKRFETHCGAVNSHHNMALEKYNSFMRPKATIVEKLASTTEKDKCEYKSR